MKDHVGHKVEIRTIDLGEDGTQYTLECDTCGEYVAEEIVD